MSGCALNCVIRGLGLAIQTGIEPDKNKVQRDSPSCAQQGTVSSFILMQSSRFWYGVHEMMLYTFYVLSITCD